jgi:hypothetical protein
MRFDRWNWAMAPVLGVGVGIASFATGAAFAAGADSTAAAPVPAATHAPANLGSIDGIWVFDAKHSDDPMKIMQANRPQGGGEGGGGRRGGGGGGGWGGGGGMGGGMGGGRRGGGGGGGGGERGGGGGDGDGGGGGSQAAGSNEPGGNRGGSPFSRVMRPAQKVVVDMQADQVAISEDEHTPRPYAIADSLKAHGHDLVTDNTSAKWKGDKLEMTQKMGQRGSLVETYELSKDGKTLTIRAHREGGSSNMPNPTFVRVYTRYDGD